MVSGAQVAVESPAMRTLTVLTLLVVIAAFWLFERDFPATAVDARFSNTASQFVPLSSGARLHYRDQGNAAGPVLVLLHGSNASLHTWEAWVSRLGDEFRIITLDLPGHGLTGKVPDDNYSTQAYIDSVRELSQHLRLSSFVLGGNSMGGGITWRYTLQHPDQVDAMLLVNASGPGTWYSGSRSNSPLAFRLLAQPWFRSVARYLDSEYLVAEGLRASHYDPAVVDDALIDRYYNMSMRAGTRHATMVRFGLPPAAGSEQDLASLEQPALVMWGREDNLIPVSTADRFVQALPHAELVIYDKVGHIPMEEVPDQSAADVRTFLRRIAADSLDGDAAGALHGDAAGALRGTAAGALRGDAAGAENG